jgi:hypothetical protein
VTLMGAWSLYAGFGASLSPGKAIDATSSSSGNNLTGGTSLDSYLGASLLLGSGQFVGAKLGYITRSERSGNTNTANSQDYSLSGGNSTLIAGFAQTSFGYFIFDGSVSYEFLDPLVKTTSSQIATYYDAYNIFQLALGIQCDLPLGMNLRFEYQKPSYSDQLSSGGTVISAYTANQFLIRLRIED